MYKMFQLYDVVSFDSTVVINIPINISSLKLNQISKCSAWTCFWVDLNTYSWIILQLQAQEVYRST